MLGETVQEIVVKDSNWEVANHFVEMLSDQDYVVMVSREEDLIIINYVHDDGLIGDRNGVAFMSREEYEDSLFQQVECDNESMESFDDFDELWAALEEDDETF